MENYILTLSATTKWSKASFFIQCMTIDMKHSMENLAADILTDSHQQQSKDRFSFQLMSSDIKVANTLENLAGAHIL